MNNKKVIIGIASIILVGLFFLASKLYKDYESERLGFLSGEDSSIFVPEYAPKLGADDAKVFLTEFLDPECETCREFYPGVKELLKEYDGKVKLVIRYAPFHHNSIIAIKALEAARKQDKYWEALEILFKYQPNWGDHHNPKPNLIFEYLIEIGVDMDKLKTDMDDPALEKMMAQEVSDLKTLNVRGTPTFFVNGKPLKGFGLDYLKSAVQEEVDRLYQ